MGQARILFAALTLMMLAGCATPPVKPPSTEYKTYDFYDLNKKPYATLEFSREDCHITLRFENKSDRHIHLHKDGKLLASNPSAKKITSTGHIIWNNADIGPGHAIVTSTFNWFPDSNFGNRCDLADYKVKQKVSIDDTCASKTHRFCE